jgi:formamidopyrimidine-DNA glycosylase
MPELPEVEIARRFLVRHLEGKTITRAAGLRPEEQGNVALLQDQTALAFHRRGKVLWAEFSGDVGLLTHLGMTGKYLSQPHAMPLPSHTHAILQTEDTAILFQDPRRFGCFWVGSWQEVLRRIPKLGPDPLVDGISGEVLREAFRGSDRPIKSALLDQQRLAGVGNIYASEALFRAKIHPELSTKSLTLAQWSLLAENILVSMKKTLDETSPLRYVQEKDAPNPFLVYDREGTPCPVCQTPISRIVQSGRSTFFCVTCQPRRRATRRAPP